jgi:hypothetical protein
VAVVVVLEMLDHQDPQWEQMSAVVLEDMAVEEMEETLVLVEHQEGIMALLEDNQKPALHPQPCPPFF